MINTTVFIWSAAVKQLSPSLKVNTLKCLLCMMELASEQECDSLPQMSYTISPHHRSFISFAHLYLQAYIHAYSAPTLVCMALWQKQ